MGRAPRKPAPTTSKLVREIHEKVMSTPGGADAVRMLKEVVMKEQLLVEPKTKWTRERVLGGRPNIKENDVVISSFGKHPFEMRRKGVADSKIAEGMQTGSIQGAVNMVMQKKSVSESKGWDDDEPPAPVTESKPGEEGGIGTTTPYRKWMG